MNLQTCGSWWLVTNLTLSRNVHADSGKTQEKKSPARIVVVLADIRTKYTPNTSQKCDFLSRNISSMKWTASSRCTFSILSPGCSPCRDAGLPGWTAVTNIPTSLPPVSRMPTEPSFWNVMKRGSGLQRNRFTIERSWVATVMITVFCNLE